MKNILYSSPVRGYGEGLKQEPTCAYFGYVRRFQQDGYVGVAREVILEMEEFHRPQIIDGLLYEPVEGRPIERIETFDPTTDEIVLLVRAPFRPVAET